MNKGYWSNTLYPAFYPLPLKGKGAILTVTIMIMIVWLPLTEHIVWGLPVNCKGAGKWRSNRVSQLGLKRPVGKSFRLLMALWSLSQLLSSAIGV